MNDIIEWKPLMKHQTRGEFIDIYNDVIECSGIFSRRNGNKFKQARTKEDYGDDDYGEFSETVETDEENEVDDDDESDSEDSNKASGMHAEGGLQDEQNEVSEGNMEVEEVIPTRLCLKNVRFHTCYINSAMQFLMCIPIFTVTAAVSKLNREIAAVKKAARKQLVNF